MRLRGWLLAGFLGAFLSLGATALPVIPRIALLGLDYSTNEERLKLESAIRGRIIAAWLRTRRFEVVERERVQLLVKEMRFQDSGLVDRSTLQRLGRLLGAELALLGRVSVRDGLLGCRVDVSLEMVRVSTGPWVEEVRASGSGGGLSSEGSAERALDALDRDLAEKLLRRYPPRGRVLRVLDAKRFIADLGSRDGLKSSQKVRVLQMERVQTSRGDFEELPMQIGEAAVDELQAGLSIFKMKKGPMPQLDLVVECKP